MYVAAMSIEDVKREVLPLLKDADLAIIHRLPRSIRFEAEFSWRKWGIKYASALRDKFCDDCRIVIKESDYNRYGIVVVCYIDDVEVYE